MRWTISAVLLRPLYSLVVLLCNHQSHQRTLDVMYIRSSALMLWPASRQDLDHPSRIVPESLRVYLGDSDRRF
ncbi:hypothetical protein F5880DRAFT_1527892 [Lentinula raphanica]|nr:hypothetical protein F5880DRAFT_1527892 [Lentinula raphanica]